MDPRGGAKNRPGWIGPPHIDVWIRSSSVVSTVVGGAGCVGPAVSPLVAAGAGGGGGVGIAPFSFGILKNSLYCSLNSTLFPT
jgi:hypothetical protein